MRKKMIGTGTRWRGEGEETAFALQQKEKGKESELHRASDVSRKQGIGKKETRGKKPGEGGVILLFEGEPSLLSEPGKGEVGELPWKGCRGVKGAHRILTSEWEKGSFSLLNQREYSLYSRIYTKGKGKSHSEHRRKRKFCSERKKA